MVLRYNDTASGDYVFVTVAECMESSESIGWADCNSDIIFSEQNRSPPYHISWIAENESTARIDWRDMSLKPITCSLNDANGPCLRSVTVHIDPEANPDIELGVSSAMDNDNINYFSSTFVDNQSESRNTNLGLATRSFPLYLPGGNWIGQFYIDGKVTWPTFAEVILNDPPNCQNSMVSHKIKIIFSDLAYHFLLIELELNIDQTAKCRHGQDM